MTDDQAMEMLRLLHLYVTEYDSCANMVITEMAEDLVMSLDETTDEMRELQRKIAEAVS